MQRLNVTKLIPVLLLGMLFTFFSGALWAQNLEIHYINVQQGQSTLIVGPNGTTILYDGGAETKGTAEIAPYLQSLGINTSQALDYIILSHRHTDHYWGLTELMNYGYDALNVYDNGSDYDNTYVQQFLTAAGNTTAGGCTPMALGQVIDLGNGATATCVGVNGYVIGSGLVAGGQDNENDRSVSLLIQYGDFDYLVTGDLGGGPDDNSCTGRGTSQVNLETPLVQAIMPGGANPLLTSHGVEVAHVSHHGSESSTNSDYMNLLSPRVAAISVGPGQSSNWYHPRTDVVDQVLLAGASCVSAAPALVLQTEEGDYLGTTSFSGYCVGDIIISTNGTSGYTVSGTGAVTTGPDERSAAGLPATFSFDEGSTPSGPIIYSVRAENVTQTTADILWTTNVATDSLVKYGTTSGSYTMSLGSGSMVTSHSIALTGLTDNTTYYYVVESIDGSAQKAVSAEYNFSTGTVVVAGDVLFSEVLYDTPGTDSIEEWVEIYNNSSSTVDLTGWTITDNNGSGSVYTIPSGYTMVPGSYFTIAADSNGFNAIYGYDADLYGTIPAFNNGGDALLLKDGTGTLKDTVAWEGGASGGIPSGWGSTSQPTASTGNSIVRATVTPDTDTYSDWSTASANGNPQTQAQSGPPSSQYKVVFSELLYDTPGTDSIEEWIELYNNTDAEVDLAGWVITDNNGSGSSYTIPSGYTIQPGTYFTIAVNSGGFNALYGFDADLYGSIAGLNNTGDALILKDASDLVADMVAWEGGAGAGIPDGWGSTSLPSASTGNAIVRSSVTTDNNVYGDWTTASNNGNPGVQSSAPKVVFSEIFYDTPGTESKEEWLELYNNSATSVDIGGWVITDNNGSGSSYTIPSGTTMAAGAYITIGKQNQGFKKLYGYNPNIAGSIPSLNNSGESLLLKNGDGDVIDFVGWEGGASGGLPAGWGSTSSPNASAGYTIVRSNVTVDTDTYADWTTASSNGNPQIQ
ncbi:MAG: MBL fold metallo-hydrolase [bacterium]|nr:MBL fold metallo-hydrolase [bacterium]